MALRAANLEPYRFRASNRIIKFKDGAEYELFSAQQLKSEGCNLNPEFYSKKEEQNSAVSLQFELFPNRKIGVTSIVNPNSKQARIGAGFPNHPRQVISKADFDNMPRSKQDIILSRPHQYIIE